MRRTNVDDLRPGDVIGKTLYNERGDVLLAAGVVLSWRYIEALKEHGYYASYVRDGIADDLEPPDLLSDRVRLSTYKHVRDLFSVVAVAATQGSDTVGNPSQLSRTHLPQLGQVYRDVERIIDEVSSIAAVSGVVSLKSHDNYTFEHSIDVTVAGVMLGSRLGFGEDDLRQLALGCLCHDIGKVAVSPEILLKPGTLTPEEFEKVKLHPGAGYEAVQQITTPEDVTARQVVWQHHERQDGTGYPRGLTGTNQIRGRKGRRQPGLMHPVAEVAAVVDVYSALSSDRPYRPALTPDAVVRTLRSMAGSHLNAEMVSRFLSMLPAYPVGSEVVVVSGRLEGYRGVVARINPGDVNRPIVRITVDPAGNAVEPAEVDAGAEQCMQLAMPSYTRLMAAARVS